MFALGWPKPPLNRGLFSSDSRLPFAGGWIFTHWEHHAGGVLFYPVFLFKKKDIPGANWFDRLAKMCQLVLKYFLLIIVDNCICYQFFNGIPRIA